MGYIIIRMQAWGGLILGQGDKKIRSLIGFATKIIAMSGAII